MASRVRWRHVDLAGNPDADPPLPPSIAIWRSRCAYPPTAPQPSHAAGSAARARHRRRCGADSRPARRRRRQRRPGRGGPGAGRRSVPGTGRSKQPLLHHAPSRTRPRARPAPSYSLRRRWLAVWPGWPAGPGLQAYRTSRWLRAGGHAFAAGRRSVTFLGRACPGPRPRRGLAKSCTRSAARLRQSRHPRPGPLSSGTPAAGSARGERCPRPARCRGSRATDSGAAAPVTPALSGARRPQND